MQTVQQPVRLRRERTKGWRKPEGAVYVGRGSRWGNPHRVTPPLTAEEAVARYIEESNDEASSVPGPDEIRTELAGKDLLCWCSLASACHADYLVSIANPQ